MMRSTAGQGKTRQVCWSDILIAYCFLTSIVGSYLLLLLKLSGYFDRVTFELGIVATVSSIITLSSPLLSCAQAWMNPSRAKLQWRLFVGYGLSSLLGFAYGLKTEIRPIIFCSAFGLAFQLISLTTALSLNPLSRASLSRVSALLLRESNVGNHYQKFTVLNALLASLGISAVSVLLLLITMLLPLNTVLSPLYTMSCLFPFIGLAISLASDIINYKISSSLLTSQQNMRNKFESSIDPPSLACILFNCSIWTVYGLAISNLVVIITSLLGVAFSLTEILLAFTPPMMICKAQTAPVFSETLRGLDPFFSPNIAETSAAQLTTDTESATLVESATAPYKEGDSNMVYELYNKESPLSPIEPSSAAPRNSDFVGLRVSNSSNYVMLDLTSILMPRKIFYTSYISKN